MEFNPQDQDIVRRLTKLKDVHVEYPANMLAARRHDFLRQMAEIGSGGNGGGGIKHSAGTPPPAAGTFLETALVIAILVEAGVTAYFYRDKLADFFQSIKTVSHAEEVTPPALPTSQEIQMGSPSPAAPALLPSTTMATSPAGITETPTGTSIPNVVNSSNSETPKVNSTPIPKGNNGNHYGQTPKAERTKKNGGNNGDNGNNNKPTKKPTKTK